MAYIGENSEIECPHCGHLNDAEKYSDFFSDNGDTYDLECEGCTELIRVVMYLHPDYQCEGLVDVIDAEQKARCQNKADRWNARPENAISSIKKFLNTTAIIQSKAYIDTNSKDLRPIVQIEDQGDYRIKTVMLHLLSDIKGDSE